MLIQLLAAPVALTLVADGVPHFDVMPSCKGAVRAGYIAPEESRLQNCVDSEQRTRTELSKVWATFPAADRAFCISSIRHFSPTYTELATCLEMKRALATVKPPDSGSPLAAPNASERPPMPRQ